MKHTIALSFIMLVLAYPLTAAAQPFGTDAGSVENNPKSTTAFSIAVDDSAEGGLEETVGNTDKKIYLFQSINVTDDDILSANVVTDANGRSAIEISFSEAGARNMALITAKNLGKRLAVFVGGKVISAPKIQERISAKAVISGRFSQQEAQRIALAVAPPPFRAHLLLIKADWAQSKESSVYVELREALKGASVPQDLLDTLPASGPEILFPTKIISFYTPGHYAGLLAWLEAKDLILSIDNFPAAKLVPIRIAGSPNSIYADAGLPSHATSLVRAADFVGGHHLFREVDSPQPFVTRLPVLRWRIAESRNSSGKRLIFQRRAYIQEDKRGQESRAASELDECNFDRAIPDNHVAIMNAFPDDSEAEFRAAARRKGFIALVVSVPNTRSGAGTTDKAQVRPPDAVETTATNHHYGRAHSLVGPSLTTEEGNSADLYSQPQPTAESTEIHVFNLKSADADSVASTFKQLFRDELTVISHQTENALIVRGPAHLLAEVQRLLEQLDKTPPVGSEATTPDNIDSDSSDRYGNANGNLGAKANTLSATFTDIESLRQAYASNERAAHQTAAQLRDLHPRVDTMLRQKLHSQVAESFRIRHDLHRAELTMMQENLEQTRETIATRDRIKDEIIDRRVADLLNPALRWKSDTAASGEDKAPVSSTRRAVPNQEALTDSVPNHLESLLKPLWPLQRERQQLLGEITELDLAVVELQQPEEIPDDATPETRQRLEAKKRTIAQRIDGLRQEIELLRGEVDNIDQKITLLKKTVSIEGVVTSMVDDISVEISIGHVDRVRIGMRFEVFDGEASIGKVEVMKIEADRSMARIIDETDGTPIRRGHRVTMLIDDRVLSELIGHDPGESIYNDLLKRFKFRLEKIDVTNEYEVAEVFWVYYRRHGNPQITAVWGDPRTNSIVVVGPPEADQAIRDTIAEWEGAQIGIDLREDETLEAQQKRFERQRLSALEQVARRKLEIVDAESADHEPDAERLKQLNLDLEKDLTELETAERKLKVIIEGMERLLGEQLQDSN